MLFNPEESIDFHGFTGPFIQYTNARIQSILRKEEMPAAPGLQTEALLALEKKLIVLLEQYPAVIGQAAVELNPSVVAIYVFTLAKDFNTFYAGLSVVNAESAQKKLLRLQLCEMTTHVIASAMNLLGIRVPARM